MPVALAALVVGGTASVALASGTSRLPGGRSPRPAPGAIVAVGAENEYANVISQIGGRYVKVSSVLDNPNTDPHTFEIEPERGRSGGRRSIGRPERRGLRHLHGQDRIGVA